MIQHLKPEQIFHQEELSQFRLHEHTTIEPDITIGLTQKVSEKNSFLRR